MALNRFAAAAKERLATLSSAVVGVVLGNESADLDSMVSAVVLARLLSAVHGEASSETVHVPVVNAPRADFELRTEAVFTFERIGLSPDSLLFIDEIDLLKLHRENRLRLTLVDHNELIASQKELAPALELILDHHDPSGQYPEVAHRIEPVGSCSTLVADFAKKHAIALTSDEKELLLTTILIDTVNLDASKGRTTDLDKGTCAELAAALPAIDPEVLFQNAIKAKFDLHSLSCAQLLRKDYKERTFGQIKCGVASVGISLEDFVAKAGKTLRQELDRFKAEHGLHFLAIMTTFQEPNFGRELALDAPDHIVQAIMPQLDRSLSLTPLVVDGLCAFKQGAVNKSRKVVLPLLQELLADIDPAPSDQ
eukprot:m.305178 g.305178  ORF g.305178 m.305178 type:complete len:367 (-) comp17592_c0_seq1:130-1230(-)